MAKALIACVIALMFAGCATDYGAVGPGTMTGAEGTASGASGNASGTQSTGADPYGTPGRTPQ